VKRTSQVLLASFVGLVVVAALSALSSEAKGKGGPPLCPDIYAPVICDNGKVYPNQCWADRNHAKNCVPYGDI